MHQKTCIKYCSDSNLSIRAVARTTPAMEESPAEDLFSRLRRLPPSSDFVHIDYRKLPLHMYLFTLEESMDSGAAVCITPEHVHTTLEAVCYNIQTVDAQTICHCIYIEKSDEDAQDIHLVCSMFTNFVPVQFAKEQVIFNKGVNQMNNDAKQRCSLIMKTFREKSPNINPQNIDRVQNLYNIVKFFQTDFVRYKQSTADTTNMYASISKLVDKCGK